MCFACEVDIAGVATSLPAWQLVHPTTVVWSHATVAYTVPVPPSGFAFEWQYAWHVFVKGAYGVAPPPGFVPTFAKETSRSPSRCLLGVVVRIAVPAVVTVVAWQRTHAPGAVA